MPDHSLRDRRILVVEDEYMLADELRTELGDVGAIVLGPVGTLAQAIDLIGQEESIDGAILDVNLRGKMAYPAADLLLDRGVPFIFTTGYDASSIPGRFGRIACCEKPLSIAKVVRAIGRAMHP